MKKLHFESLEVRRLLTGNTEGTGHGEGDGGASGESSMAEVASADETDEGSGEGSGDAFELSSGWPIDIEFEYDENLFNDLFDDGEIEVGFSIGDDIHIDISVTIWGDLDIDLQLPGDNDDKGLVEQFEDLTGWDIPDVLKPLIDKNPLISPQPIPGLPEGTYELDLDLNGIGVEFQVSPDSPTYSIEYKDGTVTGGIEIEF